MTALPHRLDRTVTIQAPRDTVFRFFTDSARWASWWGAGSTIDARPGGSVLIRMPGGVDAVGAVVEVVPPKRIVFTYGFATGLPIPPGGSTVTIELEPHGAGTRLHLAHAFAEAAPRDEHVQGWRYQLAVFGNVVANEANADAPAKVDAWFRVWSEPDAAARERALAGLASPDVQFRDRFSLLDGLTDVLPHITAAQRFMPGMELRREGDVRHCQGTVLADWTASGPDGQSRGRGTNVFVIGGDGKFTAVTGFWKV
jgi:uncharacterized protein YndB with AHSA1/START domain